MHIYIFHRLFYAVGTGSLRLVQGKVQNEGYVEMYQNGQWTGVCGHKWTLENSQVVCSQLRQGPVIMVPTAKEEYNGSVIEKHVFDCGIGERRLWNCKPSFKPSCTNAAFVTCKGKQPYVYNWMYNLQSVANQPC